MDTSIQVESTQCHTQTVIEQIMDNDNVQLSKIDRYRKEQT